MFLQVRKNLIHPNGVDEQNRRRRIKKEMFEFWDVDLGLKSFKIKT